MPARSVTNTDFEGGFHYEHKRIKPHHHYRGLQQKLLERHEGRNVGSISRGYDASTGMYALPAETSDKLAKAVEKESVLRGLATVVKAEGTGF